MGPTGGWVKACNTLGDEFDGPGPIRSLRGTERGVFSSAGEGTSILTAYNLMKQSNDLYTFSTDKSPLKQVV